MASSHSRFYSELEALTNKRMNASLYQKAHPLLAENERFNLE